MRKTKIEAQKTREHLMLSALDVFYERGVARASLNEIAQNAGVTRGALYWHFKNKEDLFDALFQHIFADMNQGLKNDIQQESPDLWDSFRCSLLNMFYRLEHNESHQKFCNILYLKCERTEQNQAIVKLMANYHQMWSSNLSSALNACVKQKFLPENLDVPAAVLYMQSILSGLILQWLSNIDRFDLQTAAARVINTSLNALIHSPELQQDYAAEKTHYTYPGCR